MVGELMSSCPFRQARTSPAPEKRRRFADDDVGCRWTGRLKDLEDHIKECDFALSPCRISPLCTVSLPRGAVAEHERNCPHLRTMCPRCGRLVRIAALQHHQRSSKCHRAQSLLAEYLTLVAHTSGCLVRGAANEAQHREAGAEGLPRPPCTRPDCLKMQTLLKHYAKCSSREEGNCPSGICDHITLLLQLHARDCTVDQGTCVVPFCAQWRASSDGVFGSQSELHNLA